MPDLASVTSSFPHWSDLFLHWGQTVLLALVVFLVGWRVAIWAERAVLAAFKPFHHVDLMVMGFFASLARWVIVTFTSLAVLDRLGVQTTSLIAVLGAAGLAIGLALQGTLTSLAAGIMLLMFRPFRVGQTIETGSITGTVTRVALFHTDLTTPENIQVFMPNSALWGTSLKNNSQYPLRRVTISVPLPLGTADVEADMTLIRTLIAADSRILTEPAASVGIAKFNGTEKTVEIEVQFWAQASDQAAVKTALMAAIWRACLKPAS